MNTFPGEIPPALCLYNFDELVTVNRAVEDQLGLQHYLVSNLMAELNPENDELTGTRPTLGEVLDRTHEKIVGHFPLVSDHVFRGAEVEVIYTALYLQADQSKRGTKDEPKSESDKWHIDSARYMLGAVGAALAAIHEDHDSDALHTAAVASETHAHHHASHAEQEQRFMTPERIAEMNQIIADVPELALMLTGSQVRALTGKAAELAQVILADRWQHHISEALVTDTGVYSVR